MKCPVHPAAESSSMRGSRSCRTNSSLKTPAKPSPNNRVPGAECRRISDLSDHETAEHCRLRAETRPFRRPGTTSRLPAALSRWSAPRKREVQRTGTRKTSPPASGRARSEYSQRIDPGPFACSIPYEKVIGNRTMLRDQRDQRVENGNRNRRGNDVVVFSQVAAVGQHGSHADAQREECTAQRLENARRVSGSRCGN